MTSGNKVSDSRYSLTVAEDSCMLRDPYFTTFTGLGSYYSKVWSGGDAPKAPKIPVSVDKFTYRVYGKDGTSRIRTSSVKRYPQGTRAPKGEHPYTMSLRKTTDSLIAVTKPCKAGDWRRYGHAFFNSSNIDFQDDLGSHWTANDDIALVNSLGDKLFGEQFNMLVFLGEGRQSLETITESSRRIARAVKFLRSGRKLAAIETLLDGKPRHASQRITRKRVTQEWVASNWLQLQYGWLPLIRDIFSAASHFANMQNRNQTISFRVGRKVSWEPPSNAPSAWTTNAKAFYGKSIIARISKVDHIRALGLLDPLSLAWEKLPYSFVADWVIPVGNYLQAINLDRSLTGTYITSSKYFAQCTKAKQITTGLGPYDSVWNESEVPCFRTSVIVSRSVSSSLNVPSPVVKPWAKISSWQHAANAVALLVNAFK